MRVMSRHALATEAGGMCRWLAYSGSPIRLEELLVKRDRSLIDQSLHARQGATTTNGDGFGVGWYQDGEPPRIYRSTHPAWNDRNLRELAAGVSSPLFFAHIRASTGSAIQETNTHPFRHGRWLWMHNGLIREFTRVRRDLAIAVDDELFPFIDGTTDSELMFFLTTVWAFRYSSEGESRSLYFTTRMDSIKALYPESEELAQLSDETRVIVSEPLGDLPGVWNEVPESHVGIVQPGEDELRPFTPLVS
jgi:predicted glutamine amidotransferase